jgi:hypothetical protein
VFAEELEQKEFSVINNNETFKITYPSIIDENPESVILSVINGFDESFMSLTDQILTFTNIQ